MIETLNQLAQVFVAFNIITIFAILGVGYMIVYELKQIRTILNCENKEQGDK